MNTCGDNDVDILISFMEKGEKNLRTMSSSSSSISTNSSGRRCRPKSRRKVPSPLQLMHPRYSEHEKIHAMNLDFLHSTAMDRFPTRYLSWSMADKIRTNAPFIYRINDGSSTNIILQQVCEERGWQEYQEPSVLEMNYRERQFHRTCSWNLWWSYNFYLSSPFRTLKGWQFTNHNSRAFQFCNKSYLTSFLRKMLADFGELYAFSPKSFTMPEDYIRFVNEHSRRQKEHCPEAHNIIVVEDKSNISNVSGPPVFEMDKNGNRRLKKEVINIPIWILKPIGRSQGKGIFITKDMGVVANSNRCVVQEYISRPLLIGGYKWDIRIYVCISSTDPLVIYIYREGLCRFATEKFDMGDLSASYSHLTNASLNKLSPDYSKDKDVIGPGCKWSLKQLRIHLKKQGISDWLLWQRIMCMILLTVVGEGLKSGYLFPANKNCFDFFGFDILVDENLRPWLLEVNYSPGLGGDCSVDEIVKKPMLHELFDLLGFPTKNATRGALAERLKSSTGFASSESQRPNSPSSNNGSSNDRPRTPNRPRTPIINRDEPVDKSCKGRLKEATSVYNQNLVLNFFETNMKNPNFRMNAGMKVYMERKKEYLKKKKESESETVISGIESGKKKRPATATSSTGSETPKDSDARDSSDGDSSEAPATKESSSLLGQRAFTKTYSATTEQYIDDLGAPYIYLQRQDWTAAPKSAGDWVLVYPCVAFPYRSPYRSTSADMRGVVQTLESYMKMADFVFKTNPNQSDAFYNAKLKTLAKWDIDIWCPPEQTDHAKSIVSYLQ